MSQALFVGGFAIEAERIMDKGLAAGLFSGEELTRATRTRDTAKRKADEDRKALAGASKSLAAAKTGDAAYKVGQLYFSAGKYAEAADAMRKALTLPGLNDVDDANMEMGIALVRLGKKAEAAKAFDAVKDPKYAEVARLWKLHIAEIRAAWALRPNEEAAVACARRPHSLRQPGRGSDPWSARRRPGRLDVELPQASDFGELRILDGVEGGECLGRLPGARMCDARQHVGVVHVRDPALGETLLDCICGLAVLADTEEQLAHRDHLVADLAAARAWSAPGSSLRSASAPDFARARSAWARASGSPWNTPAATPCSSSCLASDGNPPVMRVEAASEYSSGRFMVFVSAISR